MRRLKAGVVHTSEKLPTPYSCHQFADYVLLRHGKPLAVVEAKRTSKDANLGKEQALQYAQNLQKIHGGEIPFISHNLYFLLDKLIQYVTVLDTYWIEK